MSFDASSEEKLPAKDIEGLLPRSFPQSSSSNPNSLSFPQMSQTSKIQTLDEPVSQTIKRDFSMIFSKLRYVLNPKAQQENYRELRRWDLWGPLILCLLLALTLSLRSGSSTDVIFGSIFVLIWIGAFVVTLNARLLGGNVSFFQSVCVLGYSVFPIALASLIIAIFNVWFNVWAKIGIVGLAMVWTIWAATGFMAGLVTEKKKYLAVYPAVLFYMFLGWFAISA